MKRYCSYFDINDEGSMDRKLYEQNRMRVYYDLISEQYVAHIVRSQKKRDLPKKMIDILFNESRDEWDLHDTKIFRTKKEHDARIAGIREILMKKVQEKKDLYRELDVMIDEKNMNQYIDGRDKEEWHSWLAKRKRFLRKAGYNRKLLNWWFTVTWDPAKYDSAESWLNDLCRYLAIKSWRSGWKILGGFEFGDQNGRLHFHAVAYIPDGFFKENDLYKANRYSLKEKRWKRSLEFKEIREKFGINEFESLKGLDNKEFLSTLHYVADYVIKETGRMYYSRGLKDNTLQYIDAEDLLLEFDDGSTKYYLSSGVKIEEDNLSVMLRYGYMGVEQIDEKERSEYFRDVG